MESYNWITLILVVILVIILIGNKLFPEKFTEFKKIFSSGKYFTSHQKKPSVFNLFSFILYLAHGFTLSLALFILFKTRAIFDVAYDFIFYLQIFIILNILIGIKYLFEKIIASIFSMDNVIDNYIFYKITYKNLLAFSLYPVLLIVIYTWEPSMNILILITVLYLALNLLVLLKYYAKHQKLIYKFSFYFILYLCSLEIAPYIILYKVIT
ncbi:DUF4271 domain-containing protein [Mesonia sp.]